MLTIKNLTSGYSGNEVLHDISLQVEPGEIVGLIGPNGAGKSTVLRSIFQLAQIKKGTIVYRGAPPHPHPLPQGEREKQKSPPPLVGGARGGGGIDITKLHTHDLLELGIGFVPQGRLVFSNLTVQENLRMGGFLLNNKDVVAQNMESVFARFPVLKEKLHQKARHLSGGQQQMLAIGRALMMTPQLLLLDEPSLGLSPKIMGEIVEILKQLNAAGPVVKVRHQDIDNRASREKPGGKHSMQSMPARESQSNFYYGAGTTLMIVEQNVHLLLKFATRLYVLAAGRVVAEGKPEQFHDPDKLRKLYFQE